LAKSHVAFLKLPKNDTVAQVLGKQASMIGEMLDAAGDSGEFYTPRPVMRFMVVVSGDSLCAKAAALKRLQAETAAELDALLPAILDRAFRGEL
jgi:hypothetical protein